MTSNCPPQLQLSLQPNTTSFKRSFEQFGFDLASPVEGSGGSSNDGNDRNKRARSESSFSDSTDSTDSSQSSMLPSGSSGSRSPQSVEDDMGFASTSQPSLGPPRLPTLDIDMPDYPTEEHPSHVQHNEDIYRLSSESFNSLGSSNAVRRQPQPASPGLTRLPSPPPVLPPLGISEDQPRLSVATSAIPFLHTPPQASTPLDVLFGGDEVSSPSTSQTSAEDSEMIQGFRARLASALERLTPQSPLVPGLDLDEQEGQLQSRIDNNNDDDDSELQELTVPAEPPTLPPILSVSTTAEIDHFNIEDLLAEERSLHSLSSTSAESPSSSLISPTLDTHPLPSPILRDLDSWMDERRNHTRDDSTSSAPSLLWQSHLSRVANPIASASDIAPSSLREVLAVPFPGNVYHDIELPGSRADDGSVSENDQPVSRPLQGMGLWESHHNRPPTPPPRPASPGPSAGRPDGRLRSSSRLRSRPASTISLVTENSLEARRRADHDHVIRDLYAGLRQANEGMDVEMLNESRPESTRENVRSRPQQGPERPHTPYVLHLPPLPTPRLDVAPGTREDQESHLATPPPLGVWYPSLYRPGGRDHHEAARPRESAGNSLTQGFLPSNPEPSSAFSASHYQARPAGRLSPLRMNHLPSAASNLEWRQVNPHSLADHHDESHSHSVHWARPIISDYESPPLLPPPDFGHSFETDRDVEMRTMAAQTQEQSRRTHESHHPPPPFPYLPQRSHVSSEDLRTRGWPSGASHSSDRPPRLRPHQLQSIIRDLSSLPEIRPPPPRPNIPQEASPEERRYPWEFPPGRQQVTGDNRRAPRFFPPPRTEERSSTSAGRSFVNPLLSSLRGRANSNVTEDRARYREPSPLRNTYRNESPTIRFHHTFVGDVERQQEPVTSTSLDPSEFAPGPFRNTINQSFNRRTNRPTPPTIPPLPFEDIGPPPYFTEFPSSHQQVEGATPQGSPNEEGFASNRRTNPSSEQRVFGSSAHTRHSTLNSNIDAGNSVPVQQRLALYRHLSQRARMEPSRLDSPFSEGPLVSAGDSSQRHPLPPPPPIDPMRHDGDNMTRHIQLLEYHRLEVERRRRSMTRSEAALDDNNAERPPHNGGVAPPPLPRRFGGVDLENLQHNFRSRRRLRLSPNVLSTSRMMGNSGDFVHDDDFDDSYENLINLASSLGDVKSKSTPREVMEKLTKGKYKDWKTDDGDKRCPICLDDYFDNDILLKLNNCSHWFHHGCLQQWLHSANTCPVCRNPVQNSSSSSSTASSPRRSRRFVFWRAGGPAPPSPGNGDSHGSSTRPPGSGNTAAHDRFSNAFPGYHR